MTLFLQKYHRPLFYFVWLMLGLMQASFTELIDDEAYYWVFSKYLAWGYFDHPPMIALVIKLGYGLFHSELGVRLLCVLMNTLTILMAEKLIVRKNPAIFYMIVISIGMLQLGGILAVPDTPLLFFTALFFLRYKKFTELKNAKNAILLGLAIACLFYSKYHGLLLVIFTILSNVKLIKSRYSWMVAVVALLLYLPHLLWQWDNNWISFKYHLFESNVSQYKFSYTTEYLLGQLLLAGPIAGFILIPAAIMYRPANSLERALKLTLIGVYLLFFISSFRGKVEPNWPIVVLIPLVVLSHNLISNRSSWLNPLKVISITSFLLVTVGRIYMVEDIGPDNTVKNRFHHNKQWAQAIAERTGNIPVIFYNSYQRASRYWFYSGIPSHSFNDYRERRNNFSFWPTGTVHSGKPVYFADVYDIYKFTDSVNTRKGWVGLKYDPSFTSLERVKIIPKLVIIDDAKSKQYYERTIYKARFRIQLEPGEVEFFEANPNIDVVIWAGVFNNKICLMQSNIELTGDEILRGVDNGTTFEIVFQEDIHGENHHLRFGIQAKDYPPVHCSDKIKIRD